MKALSIQQPWAWLIVHGYKDIENRKRKTNIRGEIKIHAGKTFDRDGYEYVKRAFPNIEMPKPEEFSKGGIVGRAKIVDCVNDSDSPWFFGPIGFVISEAKPEFFVPYRGQLGFFTVNK
jgi:hypothetical protein